MKTRCMFYLKHLDEKVARLHFKKIGVELDELTTTQSE